LVRGEPDGPLEAVLVLTTLGAPERRRLRERRGRPVAEGAPAPVPTTRATVVRPEPFASPDRAHAWLDGLRADRDAAAAEVDAAVRVLNRALHAQRLASADPYVGDVSAARALVARLGAGAGEAVADGHYEAAWELPAGGRRRRRSMEAPEQRFAELLGAREAALPAEELALRARADLDAGRAREAALGARVALESALADLGEGADLDRHRANVVEAANAALRGELDADTVAALSAAVTAMETAFRRRRLGR
jgi:hypothetical protein